MSFIAYQDQRIERLETQVLELRSTVNRMRGWAEFYRQRAAKIASYATHRDSCPSPAAECTCGYDSLAEEVIR